jgi:hypothetical protein
MAKLPNIHVELADTNAVPEVVHCGFSVGFSLDFEA